MLFFSPHGPEKRPPRHLLFSADGRRGRLGRLPACFDLLSRLSAAAGIALTLALVALVVLAVHNLEFWLFRQHEQFGIVLVRRLVFAIVLFAYLFRQAFLNQKLKQRKSADSTLRYSPTVKNKAHFLFNSMNVIAV